MLYKDLTEEQKKRLNEVFESDGYMPEDATHIDMDDGINQEAILKLVNGNEYYMSDSGRWILADGVTSAENYFPIPEDFCRKTGKFMPKETAGFPDFPFKLSCGDRPEVRQWLKDNGCVWGSGHDLFDSWWLDVKNLLINEKREVRYDTVLNGRHKHIEIEPTIEVTGYTISEKSKQRQEKLDKLKELRDNAEKLNKEIEELESQLI